MGHGGYTHCPTFEQLTGLVNYNLLPFFFSEYYFTDRASMQKSVDADEFIEWAIYNGNMYGTR